MTCSGSRKSSMLAGECSTILISTCCECKRHYGVKDAHGAEGAESHGICPVCFLAAVDKLHARKAAAETTTGLSQHMVDKED